MSHFSLDSIGPAVLAGWMLTLVMSGNGIGAPGIVFEDVTGAAGLEAPLRGIMGHGAAFGDVDGDGLLDLFVGGFADRPNAEYAPAEGPVPSVLLRNEGGGRFGVWDQPAARFYARTSGAVFADLDNDGDVELYVANNRKDEARSEGEPQRGAQLAGSRLFRNDGGRLVDISGSSGACPETLGTARNIGVFDYNGDGLLDLLVVEDRFTETPRSVLLRNLGGLEFRDANVEAGLPDSLYGLGLAVADLNGDGRPDFFVGHSNRMFLSAPGDGYVESEALNRTFAWEPADAEDWPCGAAFGDLNRDGRLDLVLSIHHEKARNRLFLGAGMKDGIPVFTDVTAEAGLPEAFPTKSPHVEIQDFDNDGWPDLYFSSAWRDAEGAITPLVYRNAGGGRNVPRFEGPAEGKGTAVYFPAGPSGDYDRDGRLDLFLVNWFRGNHCRLMRNVSGGDNRWVDVKVLGRTFNRSGLGSQIKVYESGTKELLGLQELGTGYGYASGQEPVCHFGLGAVAGIEIEIRFPDGKKVRREGLTDLNRTILIEE